MPLRDDQRARYARHLLLPELGEVGQERLVAGRVRFVHEADGGARAVATSYLERAGVQVAPTAQAVESGDRADAALVELESEAECARLARRPELLEAARSLAGAIAAVETIKSLAGLGSPGARLPAGILLAEDA